MNYRTTLSPGALLTFILTFTVIFACDNQLGTPENQEVTEEVSVSGEADEPDGFEIKVLAPHAPFSDDLAARFRLKFAENGGGTIVNNFQDASTMIVAEVDWEEAGSSSGWHIHPGIALVTMVEGEIDVTWDRDCIPRSYEAGDGWLDPGDVHNAEAVSDGAKAYVVFLGIPDGEPATVWVEPAEC